MINWTTSAMPISTADSLTTLTLEQDARNTALLARTPHLGQRIESSVLPFTLDLSRPDFTAEHETTLSALEKQAARTAIESLVSLAKVNDIDHLGGGLELIPALLMTLAVTDYERSHYTIEHGHTSIGYYSALATLGFLDRARVVDGFRRSLDIAGHVSWVPGGTELSSGRLGVMVPVGTGLALGLRGNLGSGSHVICHCGDAGWISGQALDGFNAAAVHRAPITFVMHRNGIQLSGSTTRACSNRSSVLDQYDCWSHVQKAITASGVAPTGTSSRCRGGARRHRSATPHTAVMSRPMDGR